MAQNIDFDKYLAAAGFGESVSLGKRSKRVKPKAPNPVAYAESYAFIRNDATRMELEKLRMHVKVAQIKASGEGLEDIKNKVVDTVKSGASKVKKTLIELYEKAIRFFTETVRYFFSNEKKLGKTIATLKAAMKKTAKDDKDGTKVSVIGILESDINTSKNTQANKAATKFFDEIDSKDFADTEEVSDYTSKSIEDMKILVEESIKVFQEKLESSNKKEYEKYSAAYNVLKPVLAKITTIFENSRSTDGGLGVMKHLNKKIRDYQKDLKDLKKEWKENKDHDDDATKAHQVKRARITNAVKYTNFLKGINDKQLGENIRFAQAVLADFNKVSK